MINSVFLQQNMEEQKKEVLFEFKPEHSHTRKHKLSLILEYEKQNRKPFISILKKRDNSLINKKPSIIKQLLKAPKTDNNILTEEIKCFMSCRQKHTSHIIDLKIANKAIKKILMNGRDVNLYQIDFSKIEKLVECIHAKSGSSNTLISAYKEVWTGAETQYPPTVRLMLNYFGTYFYAINGYYDEAEGECQKIFDTIVKHKTEEYFIVYLLLKVKLKTNLSEWEQSVKYITKLLYFAWMYSLINLEIWCYFQFSRAYFFMKQENEANIFRMKSEHNSVESRKSIYRQVCVAELTEEIALIWQGKLDFTFNKVVDSTRLQIPEYQKYKVDEYIKDQRLLKSSIKTIAQECRIRHVNNLLNRVSELGYHQLTQDEPIHKNQQFKSGNNFLLTHQSFNKNMNMFFRKKNISKGSKRPIFYTIENSQKNWGSLKDMLKYILIQMNHYFPYSSWQKKTEAKFNI